LPHSRRQNWGKLFYYTLTRPPFLLSAAVSQIFLPTDHLQTCGHLDFTSALVTGDNCSAANFFGIIVIRLGYNYSCENLCHIKLFSDQPKLVQAAIKISDRPTIMLCSRPTPHGKKILLAS
jgi:hypothetical protein